MADSASSYCKELLANLQYFMAFWYCSAFNFTPAVIKNKRLKIMKYYTCNENQPVSY